MLWSAAGGANGPIATYCPSLGPSPSIGGGAHRPLTALCPSSPSLAYLSLSTYLSFPLEGQRSLRTVPVSLLCVGSTGNCPDRWVGASKWAPNTKRAGGGGWAGCPPPPPARVREMWHKERKMGTMVESIQPVSPANFLYNMVKIFANTGNALPPSRLRTPFGARHESTSLCGWVSSTGKGPVHIPN